MKKLILALLFTTPMIAAADVSNVDQSEQAVAHNAVMLVTVLNGNGQPVASYSVPGFTDRGVCEARQSLVTSEVMDAHSGDAYVKARCLSI